jgi:hypothetical protein
LTTTWRAWPIVSAKTVAQNPAGSVSPSLSPAQDAAEAVDMAVPALSAADLSDFAQAVKAITAAIAVIE